MNTGEIVSSVIGALAVGLLGWIASALGRMRREFHRFMAEHVWLITNTLWNRDKVLTIMDRLDIPMGNPPPEKPGK